MIWRIPVYLLLALAALYTAHFAVDLIMPMETTATNIQSAHDYLEAKDLPTPDYEFTQDGCTLWPDRLPGHDFREVCLTHDIAYWAGGSKELQKETNQTFKESITHTGPLGFVLGSVMYFGIVYFGDNGISRVINSEWGYGWK